MSETYQATYNAVEAAIRVEAQGLSYAIEAAKECAREAFGQMHRPCVLFRPKVYIDGDQWCALYGENLQDGVCGFGESVDAAMRDFDLAWHTKLPANRRKR